MLTAVYLPNYTYCCLNAVVGHLPIISYTIVLKYYLLQVVEVYDNIYRYKQNEGMKMN